MGALKGRCSLTNTGVDIFRDFLLRHHHVKTSQKAPASPVALKTSLNLVFPDPKTPQHLMLTPALALNSQISAVVASRSLMNLPGPKGLGLDAWQPAGLNKHCLAVIRILAIQRGFLLHPHPYLGGGGAGWGQGCRGPGGILDFLNFLLNYVSL